MRENFQLLHQAGIKKEDILRTYAGMPLHKDMIQIFKRLYNDGWKIYALSDANTVRWGRGLEG